MHLFRDNCKSYTYTYSVYGFYLGMTYSPTAILYVRLPHQNLTRHFFCAIFVLKRHYVVCYLASKSWLMLDFAFVRLTLTFRVRWSDQYAVCIIKAKDYQALTVNKILPTEGDWAHIVLCFGAIVYLVSWLWMLKL